MTKNHHWLLQQMFIDVYCFHEKAFQDIIPEAKNSVMNTKEVNPSRHITKWRDIIKGYQIRFIVHQMVLSFT
jgi:hypothetical protein